MNVGMVFGIILAIIVMSFVIVFGLDQIGNMFCAGSVAQVNKAIMNLEDVVGDIYSAGLGSSDTYLMSIPETAKVCFVNTDDPRPNLALGWKPDPNDYPVIEQTIQMNGYNTWIYYGCGPEHEPGYRIDYMVVDQSFCTITGEYVYLENRGMTVGVEPGG
jgi:hypothetical protein